MKKKVQFNKTADLYFEKVSTRGRPKLKLNAKGKDLIENLAQIMCTEEEIAVVLGVTVDTLHSAENEGTFSECYIKGKQSGKASLRRIQFELSKKSAPMAIWLGKQYLGQTENNQDSSTVVDDTPVVEFVFTDTSIKGADNE